MNIRPIPLLMLSLCLGTAPIFAAQRPTSALSDFGSANEISEFLESLQQFLNKQKSSLQNPAQDLSAEFEKMQASTVRPIADLNQRIVDYLFPVISFPDSPYARPHFCGHAYPMLNQIPPADQAEIVRSLEAAFNEVADDSGDEKKQEDRK